MSNKPLVSVLMTVYNREKYIEQAIRSVLNSTYTNFELIVVDDRSSDASVAIAQGLAQQDERIKVYINNVNLGDYPNRNQAASYATGKYLKYVDADDMIYPYGLEQLVYYMEQFPEAGYGLCSIHQDIDQMYPFELDTQMAYQAHYFKNNIFHKAPLSAIINTSSFKAVGGFSGKQHLGDYEMWHVLSQKYPVVLMPHGIVWYREHDDQQMNDNRSDPFVPFKYLLLSDDLLTSEHCPLNNVERAKALKLNEKKKSRRIISALKHHSIAKAIELQKISGMSFYKILITKLNF